MHLHITIFFLNIIFVRWLEMQSAPKIACLAGQGELGKTNVLLQYTLYSQMAWQMVVLLRNAKAFPLSKHTSNFYWKW